MPVAEATTPMPVAEATTAAPAPQAAASDLPEVNACRNDPCQNDATCTSSGGTFTCACLTGYFGDTCGGVSGSHFRLQGGYDKYEGRIEYYDGTSWINYYHQEFSTNEGKVICKELGLPEATDAGTSYTYGYPQTLSNFTLSCTGDEETTHECERKDSDAQWAMGSTFVKCRKDVGVPTGQDGELKLVGGTRSEGRLYVYSGGAWKGVAYGNIYSQKTYSKNLENMRVFCKTLGFFGGRNQYGHYGYNQNDEHLKTLYTCTGLEDSYLDCDSEEDTTSMYYNGAPPVQCQTTDHCAGVTCQNGGTCVVGNNFECICAPGFTGVYCDEVNPCDDGWTYLHGTCYLFSGDPAKYDDAIKNCQDKGATLAMPKELEQALALQDANYKAETRLNRWIGLKKGTDWPGDFEDGTSPSYDVPWSKPHYPSDWGGDCVCVGSYGSGFININCDYEYGIAYVCEKAPNSQPEAVSPPANAADGDFLLLHGADPSEGILHVVHNGELGTVCDDHFDQVDAGVACRGMGYAGGDALDAGEFSFAGKGRILLDDIFCDGGEDSLSECNHAAFGASGCSHKEDAALRCLRVGPRLADGPTSNEGRLEFRLNGEWGTVCNNDWGSDDAAVACRELGHLDVTSADTQVAPGTGTIGYSELECNGEENYLTDCPHAAWGDNNCDHTMDVGIECEQRTIRLVSFTERKEGYVQILHNDEWGYICYLPKQAMDIACKQLGFGKASNVYEQMDSAKDGDGKVWIEYGITCTGDEDTLQDCSITWGTDTSTCYDAPYKLTCE